MNDDLISREWLKDAFDNLCCHDCKNCRNFRNEDGFYKCNLLENAPTVPLPDFKEGYKQAIIDGKTNFSRPQGEWIPVSERLPEEKINPYTNDFDEVLCTTDWGEVQAFKFGTPIIHHKPHFWLGGAIMDEHIIAWQYKPEPYKEGGAE